MFIFYKIISYLLLPFVFLRLLYKSRKNKGYLKNIKERFGIYSNTQFPKDKPYIWVHAVSVGETKACQVLISELINTYNNHNILFTSGTPTGRGIARQIFSQYIKEKRLFQSYLPYDAPLLISNFFNFFKPKLGIILESEIWPNLLLKAQKNNIRLILANARVSPKSYKRMLFLKKYTSKLLSTFSVVAAQTETDKKYYSSLGAENLILMGNLKFDCLPNQKIIDKALSIKNNDKHRLFNNNKPIVLLASTREGEEEILLQAWIDANKPCNIIILPRHMHRVELIQNFIKNKGLNYILRTSLDNLSTSTIINNEYEVIVGNTMGEMPFYIELSDIVIMGGSWLPFGGQNILEPAMQGKTVLVGEHTYNFLEATNKSIEMQACFRFSHPTIAFNNIHNILQQQNSFKSNTKKFVATYQGATEKLISIIKIFIN